MIICCVISNHLIFYHHSLLWNYLTEMVTLIRVNKSNISMVSKRFFYYFAFLQFVTMLIHLLTINICTAEHDKRHLLSAISAASADQLSSAFYRLFRS